jgi:phenylacetate-CoA ligase
MLNVFELSDDSIPQFLARIHRFQPDVLVAYTNPLYMFARTIEERGLRAYHPKALIVGSERLHDFQRELIERVFTAPVFETYGSREFTLIGAECDRHTGLHLTMENLLVEVVDEAGNPAPNGVEGDVVITDLFNVAMPFVRYAIGDRAIAGFGSCSCGRGLPMLKEIAGRQMDILVTTDGRRLPGIFFPHLLKDYTAVRQFQVVQRERDLVELKLVVDDRWEHDSRESLRREVQHAIGDATRLLIHEVDEIPLTAVGKMRVVVGHTHLSQHTRSAS